MEVGVLYLPSVGSLEETLKGFAGKRTDLHQKSARFPINILLRTCFTWLSQPPANGMPAAVDRYGRIACILTFGRSTSMDKYLCLSKPSRTSTTCCGKRLAVPLDAENTRVLDNARALP
jgi:hypothetical protein